LARDFGLTGCEPGGREGGREQKFGRRGKKSADGGEKQARARRWFVVGGRLSGLALFLDRSGS